MITQTPPPPYYAVIFTNTLNEDTQGYQQMATSLQTILQDQDGYLGHDSVRESLGITVSYWRDLESIKKWKAQETHKKAQEKGKRQWYQNYTIRIALVEREYSNF